MTDSEESLLAGMNAAYAERNLLVAVLARVFPSGIKRTRIEGWDPEWDGCVYIDMPCGQASWHYHDREAHLFADLPPYHGEWDGHTTQGKYARLGAFIGATDEERLRTESGTPGSGLDSVESREAQE